MASLVRSSTSHTWFSFCDFMILVVLISKKFSKKLKKTFDIYNIAIIGCVFLIALSVYIIVKPDKKTSENGIEIIQKTNKNIIK